MTLSFELARTLATERERSLLEKAQRASRLPDPARPTPPSSARRRPFILARLTSPAGEKHRLGKVHLPCQAVSLGISGEDRWESDPGLRRRRRG
jgi:hypothetical protein